MKRYVVFKNPYILVEDAAGKYQPIFKEYNKDVPSIDITSPSLCCPFSQARRSVHKQKKRNLNKPGFCEICYLKYNDYETHIRTSDHRIYAQDDYHYKLIDEFIAEFEYDNINNATRSPCDDLASKMASTEFMEMYKINANKDETPSSVDFTFSVKSGKYSASSKEKK